MGVASSFAVWLTDRSLRLGATEPASAAAVPPSLPRRNATARVIESRGWRGDDIGRRDMDLFVG